MKTIYITALVEQSTEIEEQARKIAEAVSSQAFDLPLSSVQAGVTSGTYGTRSRQIILSADVDASEESAWYLAQLIADFVARQDEGLSSIEWSAFTGNV
jgi:hypothetical protein